MLRKRKTSLDDLYAFALVAEHGSLNSAATVLGVPASTVSRRVSRWRTGWGWRCSTGSRAGWG